MFANEFLWTNHRKKWIYLLPCSYGYRFVSLIRILYSTTGIFTGGPVSASLFTSPTRNQVGGSTRSSFSWVSIRLPFYVMDLHLVLVEKEIGSLKDEVTRQEIFRSEEVEERETYENEREKQHGTEGQLTIGKPKRDQVRGGRL